MALSDEQFKQLVNDFLPVQFLISSVSEMQSFTQAVLDRADPTNKLNEDFTDSRLKELLTQDFAKLRSQIQSALDALPNY